MIYVDTSVILAWVLAEDVRPAPAFWDTGPHVASRLVEYEAWVRLHAYALGRTHGDALAAALGRLDLFALDERVCSRCRAPFPVAVRTLDAVHLATADFLRCQGLSVQIATYDIRLGDAAVAMGFALAPTDQAPGRV